MQTIDVHRKCPHDLAVIPVREVKQQLAQMRADMLNRADLNASFYGMYVLTTEATHMLFMPCQWEGRTVLVLNDEGNSAWWLCPNCQNVTVEDHVLKVLEAVFDEQV